MANAIDGISYYGNCVGVPNIGGDCIYCDHTYNKNPLSKCGLYWGLLKRKNIIYGDAQNRRCILLIYVGSKTGNEGIGGAVMASAAFA